MADKSEHKINYGAFIIHIKIAEKIFIVPSIYKHDTGVPFIIGNNFLKLYRPFCQYLKHISLTCPKIGKQNKEVINIPIYNTKN